MAAPSQGRSETWTKSHPTNRNGTKRCKRMAFNSAPSSKCAWKPEKKRPKDASTYIANLEYFFNEDHSDDAPRLISRNMLGLDNLKTLYRIICTPKEPHRFKPQIHESLLSGAPERARFYDATRPSTVVDPTSPTRQGFTSEELMTHVEDQPNSPLSCSYVSACCSFSYRTNRWGTTLPNPSRDSSCGFYGYFSSGGLASLVCTDSQPQALCIANAFETTCTFGPVRNTSQQQVDVGFRARIDGSIPFGLSLAGMPPEAAIFEAKRVARGESRGSILFWPSSR
ncbi:hypothetical protein PABG_06927 [Paracoccidioides brasiliensis Pb03]|nr:hypothetical protein PABG_06927 [Paracoccidioides brasiliensis Pb03]